MNDTEKAANALATGAERLAEQVAYDQLDMCSSDQVQLSIASDPGVKALVEFAEKWAEDSRLQGLVADDARAALSKWRGC